MNIPNTKIAVFSSFALGDIVRIIDLEETKDECAYFVISEINNGDILLTNLDNQPTFEPLWVDETEIVFYQ